MGAGGALGRTGEAPLGPAASPEAHTRAAWPLLPLWANCFMLLPVPVAPAASMTGSWKVSALQQQPQECEAETKGWPCPSDSL